MTQTLHAVAVPFNSALLTSGGQMGPWDSPITHVIAHTNTIYHC